MPPKIFLRSSEHFAAISAMTKPLVLEAKMQEGLQILSSDSKTCGGGVRRRRCRQGR